MNDFIASKIPELLVFAGNHATITAESNEDRIEELLSWVESLEESPWEDGIEPHVGMQQAKDLVRQIRYMEQAIEAAAEAAEEDITSEE